MEVESDNAKPMHTDSAHRRRMMYRCDIMMHAHVRMKEGAKEGRVARMTAAADEQLPV